MQSYDNKHWEELIGTIIERIGMARFLEMSAYVADQKGHRQVADHIGRLEPLAAAEQNVRRFGATDVRG
jgi:hypothetical protein